MTHTLRRLQIPGPRSKALFDAEALYLAPGTQSVALFSQLSIDRGEGAVLYDVDGNRYIDLLAGVGVASLGYAHPKYVAAMQRQVARVHVGSFTTEHRAALVKLLAELTPGDLNRSQFYSSGAEAVEAALRLAKSRTGHTEVIGFWGGFHGKTGGVLPVLGSSFKHALGPLMPGAYLSPYASCARCAFGKTYPSCEWHCVDFLRKKIEVETTREVAAIIVEPIQGTAGNVVPPPGYLQLLRELADELGALLICDEMITGFGRTGKMFAIEHEGVLPDIMTVGKGFGGGFPMSGVIAREELAFSKPWANPSGSSSSYGGNRDDRGRASGGARAPGGRAHARGAQALGGRAADRVRRPRPRPVARHGSRRAGHAQAARQEDDALDLRHVALARRAGHDLQPGGPDQPAARDRGRSGDGRPRHHEGRAQ